MLFDYVVDVVYFAGCELGVVNVVLDGVILGEDGCGEAEVEEGEEEGSHG